jgi:uncharacterized protein
MPMPTGIAVIDLMMSIPTDDNTKWYEFLRPLLLDKESREQFTFPAQYMFKHVPETAKSNDYVKLVLTEMDRHGIEQAMIGVSNNPDARRAVKEHPDRFFGSFEVNPNLGMEGVRELVRAVEELGVRAATAFPAGLCPQVPINDKKFYPLYAKCVELDIPICICAGVPGPRVPMGVQDVALLDEVCWFFPDLKVVTRHGCEPWTDLAVKLMLKWPNLYYSTSAFAPRHYPKEIIDYANTRGADKVMYAGYFPMGLSLDRIFSDMKEVPFKDNVWPKFLRENAKRVFKLLSLSKVEQDPDGGGHGINDRRRAKRVRPRPSSFATRPPARGPAWGSGGRRPSSSRGARPWGSRSGRGACRRRRPGTPPGRRARRRRWLHSGPS